VAAVSTESGQDFGSAQRPASWASRKKTQLRSGYEKSEIENAFTIEIMVGGTSPKTHTNI
jgi:LPS sulfotransferase NodH